MTTDDDSPIDWLDARLDRALATLSMPPDERVAISNTLRFLDGTSADFQRELTSLVTTLLDEPDAVRNRELEVSRLLATVETLQRLSNELLPLLQRRHDALAVTHSRLTLDFDDFELVVAATWALEFWSFERLGGTLVPDPRLVPFGYAVSASLKRASRLPYQQGVDAARATASSLGPIRFDATTRELEVACHALDLCRLEFNGNWDEFRLVFCVRRPHDLSEPMSRISSTLASLIPESSAGQQGDGD